MLNGKYIKTLFRTYWTTKTKLLATLPGVTDVALDQLAMLMMDGARLRVEGETPLEPSEKKPGRKKHPKRKAKIDREAVLSLAQEVVGNREMKPSAIHRALVRKGQSVYLPYLGVLLTSSSLFVRKTDEKGHNPKYSVRALALSKAKKPSKKRLPKDPTAKTAKTDITLVANGQRTLNPLNFPKSRSRSAATLVG